MDGPLMTADDCRAYHKLTPTRSETNQKICVAVTAAVMINTLICAFVVIYVSSTQAKASPSDKFAETSPMWLEKQTQLVSKPEPHRAHLRAFGRGADGHVVWRPVSNSNMVYNETRHKLEIPKHGLYNIYLQVVYRSNASIPCKEPFLVLEQKVMWKGSLYNEKLAIITAIETVPCATKIWYRTVISMAQHEFRDGEIEVQILKPGFVDMGGDVASKTFWGVYLHTDIY
ncbi:uncharacterized protein LOC134445226 [Engraulis encrasicolus]|uniref:uncharacterized protein LOC134445226 n=1 Tax=Engraulis encrasicolus TaxID=184585 RepID=UPI002FD0016A